MMSESLDQPESTPVDPSVELVAYLDGELDAEASRRVEERLARDTSARRELQTLEKTWGLLNWLPRTEVGESFTHTTVEMIAVKASEDARRGKGRRSGIRRLRNWSIAASVVALAVLTATTVWLLPPSPNDELMSDLPVIENLDPYIEVGDVEFLRMLKDEELFDDEARDEG